MIPRLTGPWHPGPYPYDLFVGTAITPLASHAAVLAASFALQCEGRMTQSARLAYDRLRTLPQRLATDFFLYNPELSDAGGPSRTALGELAEALRGGGRHPS